MAILVTDKTKVLVQGITGKEGQKVTLQMKNYGTKVLAGVTPGKGGQEVHGVPVYNTIAEALENHPGINTSLISVPNFAVFGAIKEAIENKIPLINVFTEHVPIADTAKAIAMAKEVGVRLVGPSSMGIISPGIGKVGQIGGEDPRGVFSKGNVGVISKSGGMSSEVSWILTKNGVAFISGLFAESLPQGTKLGHAGAIVYGDKGSYKSKINSLTEAGVTIAKTPDEIPDLLTM